MADFKDAYYMGISAAERAEQNRAEVTAVLVELNVQLSEATEGKIEISRELRSDKDSPMPQANLLLMSMFDRRPKHWAIVAKNPKAQSESIELAKWTQDRSGYPCLIEFGSHKIHCEDKESLEQGLIALLKDPLVGEVLHLLSRRPDAEVDAGSED